MDAGFHLSDGVRARAKLTRSPYETISVGEATSDIFYGGRDRRVYVTSPEHGHPFLSASGMLKSDLSAMKLVSKKLTPNFESTIVHKGWVLISRSGTVGRCVFSNETHEGLAASEDVIRVVPNGKMVVGFLFAFLASRFGYALLTQGTFGSVISHIEPDYIRSLQIPVFPETFQKRIHKLITESARLREEADAALKASLKLFEDVSGEHGFPHETLTGRATYRSICASRRRMDAQYQLGMQRVAAAKQSGGCEQKRIGAVAKSLFVGGRGKRNYSTTGVPFISSSDMMLFNARRGARFISKRSPGSETMVVHDNDILISRSGTVGNVIIVGRDLNGVAVSEHALRLVVDEAQISPAYVFCYLKTSLAKRCMESSAYGSVIITLNEDLIADMTIPMLPRKTYDRIVTLISDYKDKLATATELENEAIDAVEAEIESWQGE